MADKARLHWFWRGAIAAVFGGTCLVAVIYGQHPFHVMGRLALFLRSMLPVVVASALVQVVWGLIPAIGALLAYRVLSRWFGSHAEPESRCRRCHHILRGLSEPRCPECGEAI